MDYIKLTFPGRIKQVGENAIEVEVKPLTYPIFSEDAQHEAVRLLGARDAERFLEEQESRLCRALLIASIH